MSDVKPLSEEELREWHKHAEFVHTVEPDNATNEAKRLLLATIRRRDELMRDMAEYCGERLERRARDGDKNALEILAIVRIADIQWG